MARLKYIDALSEGAGVRVLAILGGLPSDILTSSLACQSLFNPLLLSRLEIYGVFLGFLYDVFLNDLALKTPQCVVKGLARVYLNLRHLIFPQSNFGLLARITAHNSEEGAPSSTASKLLV